MSKYRKLIVAIMVPLVGIALKAMGVDYEFGAEQAESLMAVAIPVLTALGVWALPNVEA